MWRNLLFFEEGLQSPESTTQVMSESWWQKRWRALAGGGGRCAALRHSHFPNLTATPKVPPHAARLEERMRKTLRSEHGGIAGKIT